MDKETLIRRLNEALSGKLGAIVQYITYAAKATGSYRPQLSQFFVRGDGAHPAGLAPVIVEGAPGRRHS